MNKLLKLTVGVVAALGLAGGANASLSLFSSFSGAGVGMSTGGCGSLSQTCTLTANVPAGATILGVYIYSSMFGQTSSGAPGGTYAGPTTAATSYGPMTALGVNTAGGLQAYRRDVTSNVAFGTDIKGGNKTVTMTTRIKDVGTLKLDGGHSHVDDADHAARVAVNDDDRRDLPVFHDVERLGGQRGRRD